jgi:phospholipid transport system transporter-binding protein
MITQEAGAFRFSGPLTFATVNEGLRLSSGLFSQNGPWELDFGAVDEVDSAAVTLLLEWTRQATQQGRELHIRNLPDNLKCLLKVYGLEELLPA